MSDRQDSLDANGLASAISMAVKKNWQDPDCALPKSAGQNKIRIIDIISEIANIINQLWTKTLENMNNQTKDYDFITIEKSMLNDSKEILRSMQDICGLVLSSINQHDIIDRFKKYYKGFKINLRTNRLVESEIITLIGKVKISRYVLRPKTQDDYQKLISKTNNCSAVIPFDEFMGLNKFNFRITPLAMIKIANWATQLLSYKSASIALKDIMNIDISQETVRHVTDAVGQVIFNNEIVNANKTYDLYEKCQLHKFTKHINHILYIETDGAMIHLHHDKEEIERLKKEYGKNLAEKEENNEINFKTGWHENKLGLVFSTDNLFHKGTKQQFDRSVKIDDDDNIIDLDNFYLNKRYYVTYIGSVDVFAKLLFDCAIKNGYGKYDTTVLLSDGATWIKTMKEAYFYDAIHILDFYHLCKHIYDFAKKFYNDDQSKYVPWAKRAKHLFKTSQSNILLPEIKKMQNKLPDKSINLYQYIINNKNSIDYARYIKNNLYIGSGHIESANTSVFQERLKRPGMIWNKQNAQNLLTLRTKFKSESWEREVSDIFLGYCYSNDVLPFNFS